jgi:[protein-PII] uridylyltransferase
MQECHELSGMTRTLRACGAGDLITPTSAPIRNRSLPEAAAERAGIVHEFRRMNQLDILAATCPISARSSARCSTTCSTSVDQHILQVMRNIRRFTMSEFAHEYPLCSRIISELERPWLLLCRRPLPRHRQGRGDHSELGTVDAKEFCQNHQLTGEDTELIVWLVKTTLSCRKSPKRKTVRPRCHREIRCAGR